MKAFIFPGQGSQFPGMGHDLYQSSEKAKDLFELADSILGFNLSKIMFEGTDEELKKTNITQPAIFIHSVILSECINIKPDMVAGHSLGEFSALVSAKAISFEDGLKLVVKRAEAMHLACEKTNSTMAAIIGLDGPTIEQCCHDQIGIVVPANYNAPNQIVISGERTAIEQICNTLNNIGAKRTVILPVSGAFHSPIMNSAKQSLQAAIFETKFKKPTCPIYQNIHAKGVTDEAELKENLIQQLTSPVKWFQTIEQMALDNATEFFEVGPGNILSGLSRRINREIKCVKAQLSNT